MILQKTDAIPSSFRIPLQVLHPLGVHLRCVKKTNLTSHGQPSRGGGNAGTQIAEGRARSIVFFVNK